MKVETDVGLIVYEYEVEVATNTKVKDDRSSVTATAADLVKRYNEEAKRRMPFDGFQDAIIAAEAKLQRTGVTHAPGEGGDDAWNRNREKFSPDEIDRLRKHFGV